LIENSCKSSDDTHCWAKFKENGEWVQGLCDDLTEDYSSLDDDECETVCSEVFECPDHSLDWCEMT